MTNVRFLIRMQSNMHPKCIRRLKCFRTVIANEISLKVVHQHMFIECSSGKRLNPTQKWFTHVSIIPSTKRITLFSVFFRTLHTHTLVHRGIPYDDIVHLATWTNACISHTHIDRNRHDNVLVCDEIAVNRLLCTSICIYLQHTCREFRDDDKTFGDTWAPLDCQEFLCNLNPDILLVSWNETHCGLGVDVSLSRVRCPSISYRYGIAGSLLWTYSSYVVFCDSLTDSVVSITSGTNASFRFASTECSKSDDILEFVPVSGHIIDDGVLFNFGALYGGLLVISSCVNVSPGFQSNSVNVELDCRQFTRNVFITQRLRKQSRQMRFGNFSSCNCDFVRPVNVRINCETLTSCRLPPSTTVSWPKMPIVCSFACSVFRRHSRQIWYTLATEMRTVNRCENARRFCTNGENYLLREQAECHFQRNLSYWRENFVFLQH